MTGDERMEQAVEALAQALFDGEVLGVQAFEVIGSRLAADEEAIDNLAIRVRGVFAGSAKEEERWLMLPAQEAAVLGEALLEGAKVVIAGSN